jgi:hypothetical protein
MDVLRYVAEQVAKPGRHLATTGGDYFAGAGSISPAVRQPADDGIPWLEFDNPQQPIDDLHNYRAFPGAQ